MAKVPPIHSKKPGARRVYHDDNDCSERNHIERKDIILGTGGRPKCEQCERLSG